MTTPWIESLELPRTDSELKAAVRVEPKPVGPIHREPVDVAVGLLSTALEVPYRASDQHVQIIRRVLGPSSAHARQHYSSEEQFLRAMKDGVDLPPDPGVAALTGHPGVGKTAILAAIARLMATDRRVLLGRDWPEFPLNPVALVPLRKYVRNADLYTQIAAQVALDEVYAKGDAKDARHLKFRLYQRGCAGLLTDELQFVTRSDSANAKVSMLLTHLTDLGIPLTFACNYSLVHRLLKRPPEERVRMLSSPIVMLPDEPDDPDYVGYLEDLKVVMGDMLAIEPARDAAEINQRTFGLKRPLHRLIKIAFRIASRRVTAENKAQVTLDDLRAAYRSTDYQTDRKLVEDCQRALVGITSVAQDVICPFELPPSKALAMKERAQRSQQEDLAQRELASALGPGAARSKAARDEDARASPTKASPRAEQSAPVTGGKQGRLKPPRTAADLLAGLSMLRPRP